MTLANDLERYLLQLVNEERTSRGLNALVLEQNLNSSADAHSEWMSDADIFDHTGENGSSPSLRMGTAGFDMSGSWRTGENIAVQSVTGADSYLDEIDNLHLGLMNSPGHRANLLDPEFTHLGLGIYIGNYTFNTATNYRSVFITQNFARTSGIVDLDLLGTAFGETLRADTGDDHAVAGAGNDVVYGYAGMDSLYGGAGNDSVSGGQGNDHVFGEDGNDYLSGDAGFDLIRGGAGADKLFGGAQADNLYGDAGNDTLHGEDGNDRLFGGNNNDLMYGDGGDDVMFGGFHQDSLFGGDGNDRLYGDAGFDFLRGGLGNDQIFGGAQADNLYGDAGNDTLMGEDGFDRLFGGIGDDFVAGGNGSDALFGDQGNDTLLGQEGNDRFFAGQGNDLIEGGDGDDWMNGNAGFDTMNGGAGDDIMFGRFNADIFVFADMVGGFGNDTINDFDAFNAFERIDLSGVAAIADFTDLMADHASQVGANVLISAGDMGSITLLHVSLGDLDQTDFIF